MIVSSYIQLPHAVGFIEAATKAYFSNKPWNTHIVIHLEQSGVKPKDAAKYVQQCIQKLGKYHKRNGMGFSYGWVLENAPVKGTHLHLLAHRSDPLPMHYQKYRWVVLKIFKIPNEKKLLQVRKFWTHQCYERNLTILADYVLKGIRPGTENMFLERTGIVIGRAENQGIIYGKRISWSR